MRASRSASSSRPLTMASALRTSEPTEKPLRYQATCLRKSVQPCRSPCSSPSSVACRCMTAATSRRVGSARSGVPAPAVLRYGLRALLSPRSPVYLPLRADPTLARFLTGFVRHSTTRGWRRGLAAYVPLNERALEAFDVLAAGGVPASTHPAEPFLAGFANARE